MKKMNRVTHTNEQTVTLNFVDMFSLNKVKHNKQRQSLIKDTSVCLIEVSAFYN